MNNSIFLLLLLLTFTTAAYNYQFYNVPSSLHLNAWKLPADETPYNYTNVTTDVDFRVNVIDYVIASDAIRSPIKIPELTGTWFWLENVSNLSGSRDLTIKFFNDYYYLQIRYYADFQRTFLEYTVLWSIDGIAFAAWIGIILLLLHHGITPKRKEGRE